MVPPPDQLNPDPLRSVEDPDAEDDSPGRRWSWVFWLLCAAALAPTAAAIATVQHVLTDEELLAAYDGGVNPDLVFADRWSLVVAVTGLSWPAVASVLGVLAVAAVALSGRPQWLAPARGRFAVGVLATVCGLWSAVTTTLTVHGVLTGPTARQVRDQAQGSTRPTLFDVGPDAVLSVLVVAAVVFVLVALRQVRPSHPGIVEDPPEGAQPQ